MAARICTQAGAGVGHDSGAVVAVTVQTMDGGDCASMPGTLEEAGTRLAALEIEPEEVVADKGYHSNATMKGLKTSGLRGYVSEPDRGRRNWTRDPDAQNPTYANRRRIRGRSGQAVVAAAWRDTGTGVCASSGERWAAPCACAGAGEHPQAHAVHAAAFNLGLLMRSRFGYGLRELCRDVQLRKPNWRNGRQGLQFGLSFAR